MPDLNIKTVGGNGTFEDVIAAAPPEVQVLACAARALCWPMSCQASPRCPGRGRKLLVTASDRRKCRSNSVISRPSRNTSISALCTAHTCRTRSNLLEGKGVDLRHVKIRKAADLEQAGLRELIGEASRYLPKLK